jgi:bacterioferritin
MTKGSPALITHLNQILKNELTAINQYFLHSKTLKHMGYSQLAAKEWEESIDEMKHADKLIERILFLGGLPNLQDLGKLMVGETPKEMLEADHALEVKAIADLRAAIAEADDVSRDKITTQLLEEILASEEGHIDWLRQQLDLIRDLGEPLYLQTKI